MDDESFSNRLDSLVKSLDKEDIHSIGDYGIKSVFDISKLVKIDREFLRAAARYWDPNAHTFRIRDQEIGPTPEDWTAILGISQTQEHFTLPSMKEDYTEDYKRNFQLSNQTISTFLNGQIIDLNTMMDVFYEQNNRDDPVRKKERMKMVCMCVLHKYVFVGKPSGKTWADLINILEQLKNKKSPAVLVLAETILGLDKMKNSSTPELENGSPLLLQIWLLDRLSLVNKPPPDYTQYDSTLFYKRPRTHKLYDEEKWAAVIKEQKVTWVVPWWQICFMRYDTKSIELIGFRDVNILIYPSRFMRQYGWKQVIPPVDPDFKGPVTMTPDRLKIWPEYYAKQKKETIRDRCEDTELTPNYRDWLLADDKPARDQARQRERELTLKIQADFEKNEQNRPRTGMGGQRDRLTKALLERDKKEQERANEKLRPRQPMKTSRNNRDRGQSSKRS